MLVQSMPYPASAGGDPYFSNVVLLLPFDNGAGVGSFNDFGPTAKTGAYAAAGSGTGTTTATAKFGSHSWVTGATGRNSQLLFADSADWNFGSGAFTVECWVRFDLVSSTALQHLFGQYDVNSQRAWVLQHDAGALKLLVSGNGTTTTAVSGTWAYTQNTWYHVAAAFDGTKYRVFVDGVMKGSLTSAVTIFNSTAPLSIGMGLNAGATNTGFQGYLDEIRVTKGVARYASDAGFVAPIAAFPRS